MVDEIASITADAALTVTADAAFERKRRLRGFLVIIVMVLAVTAAAAIHAWPNIQARFERPAATQQ